MITNEVEIRIALQAVLVSGLALNGYWGWALLVLFILLPWKPIFAVIGYLVQPVVDWRMRKARDRQGQGITPIEQELDALLKTSARSVSPGPAGVMKATAAERSFPSLTASRPGRETSNVSASAGPVPHRAPGIAPNPSAATAILPVIRDHVRNLPQGVFHNMDLEVEQVRFHGETADAFVRFRSPNVSELILRQHYVLRKAGAQWLVESRQPTNGGARIVSPIPVTSREPKWLT